MNITFLQNKKILNLGLRWHILRSYHFVAEVTFKATERRRAGGEAHCSTIFATIQKRNVKYVIGTPPPLKKNIWFKHAPTSNIF